MPKVFTEQELEALDPKDTEVEGEMEYKDAGMSGSCLAFEAKAMNPQKRAGLLT